MSGEVGVVVLLLCCCCEGEEEEEEKGSVFSSAVDSLGGKVGVVCFSLFWGLRAGFGGADSDEGVGWR